MSAGHDHTVRASRRHLRPLSVAFGLVAMFMIVEGVAGLLTGSLALLSDAGHMATDALGLGMALAAIIAAGQEEGRRHRTFGLFRIEILAALANALLLFGVAGYVLWEAIGRLDDPPDIPTGTMLVVALGGLVVNIVSWVLLRRGAGESLNVEGAYLEVLADLVGSIGVVVGAVVIRFSGWSIVDPILGAAIGLFILPRAWRLAARAVRILVQAAPEDVDLDAVEGQLLAIDTVVGVHDLHVWTLTSEMHVGTAHVVVRADAPTHPVLDRARDVLESHGVAHATLQVEPETHEGCAEISW